jgi:hypothetical protein
LNDICYVLSTILDPRFKLKLFSFKEYNIDLIKSELSNLLFKYEYKSQDKDNIIATNEIAASIEEDRNIWDRLDKIVKENEFDTDKKTGCIESELSAYMLENTINRRDDIFEYWRNNSLRFPMLSLNAKKYLSCPPSSVPSERVFSTAGDVIDDHRSCLLAENAKKLIYLKVNLEYFK